MDPTYYYTSPLSPTGWGPLIRAPLSSEYSSSNGSGSELDPLSNSDEDADVDGLVRPVARLTNDDDLEDEDEVFDEVDGDGFCTVARIPSHLGRSPGSDEEEVEGVEEEIGGDLEGIYEKDGILGGNSDGGEEFEADVDGGIEEEVEDREDDDLKLEEETFGKGLGEKDPNLGENYNEAVESSGVGEIGNEKGDFDALHETDENSGSNQEKDGIHPSSDGSVEEEDDGGDEDLKVEEETDDGDGTEDEAVGPESNLDDNASSILKGEPDVVKGLTIRSDGRNASEATELSDKTVLYTDDSKTSPDNLDAVNETLVVNGSINTTESHAESNVLVNELASDSSDSIIIEEEMLPVSILEDSKTMSIKGLVDGSPILVQSSSHSTKDEIIKSNSFITQDYADIVPDEIGKENRNLDSVHETNCSLEPREVEKCNFADLEKDEVEEDSKYKEVKSVAIEVAEVGNITDVFDKNYGLVVEGNSDSRNKEAESGAIEAANATDSNRNHCLVVEGSSDSKNKEVESGAIEAEEVGIATDNSNQNHCLAVEGNSDSRNKEVESCVTGAEEVSNATDNSNQNRYLVGQCDPDVIEVPPLNLDTNNANRATGESLLAEVPSLNLAAASKVMTEEEKKLHEKVESIRVMYLRLVDRLGYSYKDFMPITVLNQLALVEDLNDLAVRVMHARKKAFELEREEKDKLEFSCTILLIGKVGVGKSSIINSMFDKERTSTNPFQRETTSVRKIEGVLDGVTIQIVDTPGLSPYILDQPSNMKILRSIKKYMKRCPADIVVYVDRLDTQVLNFNDLPVLRSITRVLGSSVWSNALIALTHASKAPPEGPSSFPLSYDGYVNERAHVVQRSIQRAVGNMRLINPVILVENHPSCRRNREGQRVLPNGSIWISQLLLMCYSLKILVEASSLSKVKDSFLKMLFGFHFQSPPMHFFWSTLLESKVHPNIDSGIELDALSNEKDEVEDEYDQLPPFRPLSQFEIAKLTEEHKRAYFDEYNYRVKLLEKKQLIKILEEMKRNGENGEDSDDDYDCPTTALPPSFDSDDPAYRYRITELRSQLLKTGPILDPHGWDHDCGYDMVSLEKNFAFTRKFPAAIYVKLKKDKEDFNIQMDSSVSAKHGEIGSTVASFDIRTIGNHQVYIVKAETKFKNLNKKNKTALGVSLTSLGETVATGLKLEDQLSIGKRINLLVKTGAVQAEGNMVYGALLEAMLREKDNPIGQAPATLGLSVARNRGDLVCCGSLQSQLSVGRNSRVSLRVGMNDKKNGQIAVRVTSSDQLHMVLMGLMPILYTIFRKFCF